MSRVLDWLLRREQKAAIEASPTTAAVDMALAANNPDLPLEVRLAMYAAAAKAVQEKP